MFSVQHQPKLLLKDIQIELNSWLKSKHLTANSMKDEVKVENNILYVAQNIAE